MEKEEIINILRSESLRIGLEKYVWIQQHLFVTNVAKDKEFQRHYNGFYRVRQRKMEFYNYYYTWMENMKNCKVTFEETLQYLSVNTGKYESSFSSKLVATINPEQPVWDTVVLGNIGLKPPNPSCNNRAEKIVGLYYELENWYKSFLNTPEADNMISLFNETYPDTAITNIKKIDLILWQKR